MHIAGIPGLERDLEKGQRLLLQAATAGDVDASRVVGEGFLSGWMGSIDPARAARYFRYGMDKGDPKSTFRLADLVMMGNGVKKDELEADRLTEKAALLGDREAQSLLGMRKFAPYVAGLTDESEEALKWLTMAADQNEPTAMRSILAGVVATLFYLIYFLAVFLPVSIAFGVMLAKAAQTASYRYGCYVMRVTAMGDAPAWRSAVPTLRSAASARPSVLAIGFIIALLAISQQEIGLGVVLYQWPHVLIKAAIPGLIGGAVLRKLDLGWSVAVLAGEMASWYFAYDLMWLGVLKSQAIDGLPVIFATLAGYWIVDTILLRREHANGLDQAART
jgi:Sel1 repeat